MHCWHFMPTVKFRLPILAAFSQVKKVTFSLSWHLVDILMLFLWPKLFKSLMGKFRLPMLFHHLLVSIHTSLAHRIIESLRLEKIFQILKSNHKKNTCKKSKGDFFPLLMMLFTLPLMTSDLASLLHVFVCTFFLYSIISKIIVSSMNHRKCNFVVSRCCRTCESWQPGGIQLPSTELWSYLLCCWFWAGS